MEDLLLTLSETVVRVNCSLIHELLDEFFDLGYPQFDSTRSLQHHIVNKSVPCTSNDVAFDATGTVVKSTHTPTTVLHSLLSPLQHVSNALLNSTLSLRVCERVQVVLTFDSMDVHLARITIHGGVFATSNAHNSFTFELRWANPRTSIQNLLFHNHATVQPISGVSSTPTSARVRFPSAVHSCPVLQFLHTTDDASILPLQLRVYCSVLTTEITKLTVQIFCKVCTVHDVRVTIPIPFVTGIKCSHVVHDTDTRIHHSVRSTSKHSTILWSIPTLLPSNHPIYLYSYLHTPHRSTHSVAYSLPLLNLSFNASSAVVSSFTVHSIVCDSNKDCVTHDIHYHTSACCHLRVN
uniref:AP-1 complex subunit mu-1-I n=1 Tax=Lygus hesperus TaxID=30085 RepID=A0A0A9W6U7_LYGHE